MLQKHVLYLHSFLRVVLFAMAIFAVQLSDGVYAAGAALSTFIRTPFAQQVRLKRKFHRILKKHVLYLHSFLLVVLFAIAICAVQLT
jgi:hypothetical protein